MRIASFDGTESVDAPLHRPDQYRDLFHTIDTRSPLIGRGAGLSYCLGSAGSGVNVVSSAEFNRILEFNEQQQTVVVESGMKLGDLLLFAISKGLYVPVLPGHPSITVGGSIGFNVHGKSQFKTGNFDGMVDTLWLYHPGQGEIECSRENNSELFELTLGGFGLTGFITKAKLTLAKLAGQSLQVAITPVRNLLHAAETMRELGKTQTILYSWNNLNRRGEFFGQGYIYSETFAQDSVPDISEYRALAAPTGWRDRIGVWNALSIPCMTAVYGLKERLRGSGYKVGLRAGSFPISGKEIYFGFYPARGFREYQFIVPFDCFAETADRLQALLAKHGCKAGLGSLKLFEGETKYPNFCASGVCVSLDVCAGPQALALFSDIDQLVVKTGCVVNIAKDSRLSREIVERVFPQYEQFRGAIRRLDPALKYQSSLRNRLEL